MKYILLLLLSPACFAQEDDSYAATQLQIAAIENRLDVIEARLTLLEHPKVIKKHRRKKK